MQVIIPMSGRGNRFIEAGYTTIKPLIEVDGLPIIDHVINLFPHNVTFTFICAEDHLEGTPLRKILAPKGKIVGIAPHKKGPVWAVLQGIKEIDKDEPTIVSYCDFSGVWNYNAFVKFVNETQCDGCIPSYRGFHPHSLGPNFYAYLRTTGDRVLEIKEKGAFTNDRMNEFASAGIYYFKSGKLLEKYFSKAVEEKLELNGEFYASLPYNLLIKDKLDVRVFEMDQFLQWGTPEDLKEYLGWSDWFKHWEGWSPKQKIGGRTLIPAAGSGKRFSEQGYREIKPLIQVDGKAMLQRTLETLPAGEVLLAVNEENKDLSKLGKTLRVGTTQGQAHTCLLGASHFSPNDPLLISSCDAAFGYDADEFAGLVANPEIDLIVWTFRNHPHANRRPEQYGWVVSDSKGSITSLSCKKAVSSRVDKDPGVTGTFWFRKTKTFTEEGERMMRDNYRINGEFYVDSVAERLIKAGARAKLFDVTHFICFGTPDDVRTFEYWAKYFRRATALDAKVA